MNCGKKEDEPENIYVFCTGFEPEIFSGSFFVFFTFIQVYMY